MVDVLQGLVLVLGWGSEVVSRKLGRTAAPIPRKRPFGPSFFRITPTPWKTPLYMRGASFLDCSSPCSCKLLTEGYQHVLVFMRCIELVLPNLDCFEGMCDRNSSASCDAASQKGPKYVELVRDDFHYSLSRYVPCGCSHSDRRKTVEPLAYRMAYRTLG